MQQRTEIHPSPSVAEQRMWYAGTSNSNKHAVVSKLRVTSRIRICVLMMFTSLSRLLEKVANEGARRTGTVEGRPSANQP